MRCLACDAILTDLEATRKDKHGEFIDICFNCDPVDSDNYEPDCVDPVWEEYVVLTELEE